jgi:regulator of protease activity HflC (stomatin/prohibitin superfamily)
MDWVAALGVGASALGAVLLYRYVDVGSLGPLPDMYENTWQVPGKLLSAYAEGAAVVLAGLGLLIHRSPGWNRSLRWQRCPGREDEMSTLTAIVVVVAVLVLVGLALSVRIVQQYEKGVLFRLGRVIGVREPGLTLIIPVIDVLRRVSLRIVTMPIQSQGIITHDNVSIDVSAVAYYRVTDAVKAVVAIENVAAAINQIAQTTLRKVVGQHTLDQTLAETDRINVAIREILDGTTEDWGVVVTLVELKDIQLPETMQRAMARQAEAEREKRAKIIAAEGESLAADQLGAASDVMMAHPLALQLRNLQSLVEIGVDKNTTVVFPAPLMSTIQELGAFLAREQAAGTTPAPTATTPGTSPSPASPATSTGSAVELPATDAGFNTDYNGAAAARPR